MEISEFKRRAVEAFGADMEHATPANVREFVDSIYCDLWSAQRADASARAGYPHPPVELDGRMGPVTYEGSVRQFFARTLEAPGDHALLLLWLYSLDLAYADIEQLHSEQLNRLFTDDSVR